MRNRTSSALLSLVSGALLFGVLLVEGATNPAVAQGPDIEPTCTSFTRADMGWDWNNPVTVDKGGITVTNPAGTHDNWEWFFTERPLDVVSVAAFSNGGWQSAETSPGTLTGQHGSNIQEAEFCHLGAQPPGSTDQEPRIRCVPPGPPGRTELENLGPAITGFPVNMADRVGDQVYAFSHRLNPTRIAEYDLASQQVTSTVEVPTDPGIRAPTTWGTTAHGTDLYFHQSAPAPSPNLYRYDTVTGELEGVARIPGFLTLATGTDDRIYAGTPSGGAVTVYDPGTGSVETIDIPGSSAQTTALASSAGKLYVGTHRGEDTGPQVFEIDLTTRAATDITPPEIADATRVYQNAIAATSEHIAFGTQQEPARFTIVSAQDPNDYHSISFEDESLIGSITFADAAVYFSGISTGNLYRYDLQTRDVEHVATPVADVPTRRSFAADDALVGVSAPGLVWHYDPSTGDTDIVDLVGAGAVGAPEQPQSLAVTPSNIVVGKNNGVKFTPLDTEGDPALMLVPGEAKAMVTVGEDVYIALYPQGRLWRYDGATGTVAEVADWRDVQNRPKVAYYHRELDQVLVGVQSDTLGGGALVSHDRTTGETQLFEQPFGVTMRVDAVTGWQDQAVIGGSSVNARVALIDPISGELGWSTVPVPGGGDIRSLVTDREVIHGLAANGTVFTLDPDSGEVLRTVAGAVAGSTPGELLVHDQHLYAVSRQQLVKLPLTGPDAFEPIVVADDLDGGSFNRPPLRRGPDCSLYLFTDRDLLRVRDDNRPDPHAPRVSAEASPTSGQAPLEVEFSGSATSRVADIVSYEWSFGDGLSAQGAEVTHTYLTGGQFNAVLTATDEDGREGTATVELTVEPPRPECPDDGDGACQIVTPTHDAFVRGGDFADDNYGASTDLVVKLHNPDFTREAYLTFDLSQLDVGDVERALLYLHVDAGEGLVPIDIRHVPNPGWDEDTITWNARPEPDQRVWASFEAGGQEGWHVLDLSDLVVEAHNAGAERLGLALQASVRTSPLSVIASKERSGELGAQLVVQ